MKPQIMALISTFALGLPTLAVGQSAADTNGDGALDQDEITIAEQAGLLPPSNG